MLEKYEKDFDENEFMRSFMERKQISTKKQALAELRKLIKKEGYYQTKIKEETISGCIRGQDLPGSIQPGRHPGRHVYKGRSLLRI